MSSVRFDLQSVRDKFDALPQEEKERVYAKNKKRLEDTIASWNEFKKAYPEIAESMMCAA